MDDDFSGQWALELEETPEPTAAPTAAVAPAPARGTTALTVALWLLLVTVATYISHRAWTAYKDSTAMRRIVLLNDNDLLKEEDEDEVVLGSVIDDTYIS